MINIIIFIVVYIISFFLYRKWVNIAYGKNGSLRGLTITNSELFLTICPVINTVACIMWIVYPPSKDTKWKKIRFLKKFFNIN